MPKAVAILEGDSTGLVKSINDAKGAMQKLEGEGKKLTDQLRDVADEADKAAGSLVQRIGGPTAIKAIAGVTAGFAAAQTALGAFSGSMQAFAATQGAAGQKAMADLDASLNELQGQLFTAVMGTEDLDEAMKTILGVVDGLKVAFGLLLVPVTAFSALVRQLTTDQSELARTSEGLRKAEVAYQEALAGTKTSFENADKMYGGVQRTLITLLGTKKELAAFELEQQASTIHAAVIAAETAETQRRNAALNLAMDRAEAKERAKASFDSYEAAFPILARNKIDKARAAAREEAEATLEEQDRGHQEQLARMREALVKLDKMKQEILKAPEETESVPRRTGGRSAAVAPAAVAPTAEPEVTDPYELRRLDQERWLEEQRIAREQELKETAKANKERIAMFGSATDEQIQLYYEAQIEKTIADKAAFEEARQRAIAEHDLTFDLTQDASKWAEEQRAKEKAASDEKVAGIEAGLKEYGNAAAQQLAAGEKASKIAEKMARKALGGQIAALGDKAMAEAAIMAAALNPMAIPMGAAGIAAYAAAAALGSDAKKATSSTPAVATAPQQMNTNVSYNLQVDAAFANGESIARQFSMAQREAQRRGMMPAGVF